LFLRIVDATLDFQQDASGGGAASAVRLRQRPVNALAPRRSSSS
jgi:hypothetical protein